MTDNGRGLLGNPDATTEEITKAMTVAIYRALCEHKRAGNPVAGWDWEKKEVVIVQPEDIVIPEEYDEPGEPEDSGPAGQ